MTAALIGDVSFRQGEADIEDVLLEIECRCARRRPAVGRDLLCAVTGTELGVSLRTECEAGVYLCCRGTSLLTSSCFPCLLTASSPRLSADYFHDFVRMGELPSPRLPWENHYKIGIWDEATYRRKEGMLSYGSRLMAGDIPPPGGAPPLSLLEDAIAARIREFDEVKLEFSGGFDSTVLATIVAERAAGRKVSAHLWSGEGITLREDLVSARRTAGILGVPLKITSVNPQDIFPDRLENFWPDRPSVSFAFAKARWRALAVESAGDSGQTIVLNGHGGDHLLCDPARAEFFFDPLFAGRAGIAWRILRSIARLRDESYPAILRQGFGQLSAARPRAFRFRPGKWLQLSLALEAAYECNRSLTLSGNATTTTRIWIRECSLPSSRFLRSSTLIKTAYAERSGMISPERIRILLSPLTRKGHITGLFQRAAHEKLAQLRTLIHEGFLQRAGIIDAARCEVELERASLGIHGFNPALMRTICAELFIQQWSPIGNLR